MLQHVDEGLWVAHRPLRFLGAEVGTRMTVVRLRDGSLFVHSPVLLDQPTKTDLDGLGPVRFVIAPNRFHHLFLAEYTRAYPEAKFFAAPGLSSKRKDLRFDAILDDVPPAEWNGQIDQVVFREFPPLNEVVFFHRELRSLIVTDLLFNVRTSESAYTRFLMRLDGGLGRVAVARSFRWLIKRRRAQARLTVDKILSWDFDRLIVTHGEVVASGAKEMVRAAWDFL
jgi:hypothetical protein